PADSSNTYSPATRHSPPSWSAAWSGNRSDPPRQSGNSTSRPGYEMADRLRSLRADHPRTARSKTALASLQTETGAAVSVAVPQLCGRRAQRRGAESGALPAAQGQAVSEPAEVARLLIDLADDVPRARG